MCSVYEHFSLPWKHLCEYGSDAMLELYYSESYGDPVSPTNGYYLGKKQLNITVSMWKEDIARGLLFTKELYDDPNLPDWWLDKVFKNNRKNNV